MQSPDYKTTIKYAGDEFFIGTSASGHAQTIDTKSNRKAAASPLELLLLAVGSCTAIDVVSILEKKRQQVSDYQVEVTGTRRDEHPRSFTNINIHHIVYGRGVSAKAVADAVRLSEEKYCSVAANLKPAANITTSFEIIEIEENV